METDLSSFQQKQQAWLPQNPSISRVSLQKIKTLHAQIYQYVSHKGSAEDLVRLEYAFEDVAKYHEDQVRKSGEPVIIHPLRVAWLVCDAGLDAPSVVAALLHDTIEDTELSRRDIKERYGKWYADIVDGLTKIKTPTDSQVKIRSDLEATYQKMLMAMVKDVRALFIKLFDRLDNMRDLEHMPRTKQRRISKETLTVYVPMARRLGLQTLSDEHTELCFKFLYPIRYQRTIEELAQLKEERWPIIEKIQNEIIEVLRQHKIRGVRVEPILIKAASLIKKKESVEHILEGFRCLVSTVPDSYKALGALHTHFRAVPLKVRDFISNPRWNGYRGLQTKIFIQGETVSIEMVPKAMHVLNEHGIMSHWKGTASEVADYYKSYFNQLDKLVTEDDLRVNDVLRYVQSDQIQLFTPNGEPYFFPKNATVLDFAYQVHTDLGNSCTGALINPSPSVKPEEALKKAVPLNRKLVNGETVKILTDAKIHPIREWLDIAVTARAHISIKKSIKQQNLLRARQIGHEMLMRDLRSLGIEGYFFIQSDSFQKALEEAGLSLDRLLERIALQKTQVVSFLKRYQLVDLNRLSRREFVQQSFIFKSWEQWFHSKTPDILIRDLNDPFIQLASCCSPIPYDLIIGMPTEDHGVMVHRITCEKLNSSKNPTPIAIGWNLPNTQIQSRRVEIKALNQQGILYQITKIINDFGIDIESIGNDTNDRSKSDGSTIWIFMTLAPMSWKLYYKIIERLRTLKFIQIVR